MSPKQLFLFAQTEIPTVNFYFATTDEYQKEAALLNDIFESACTLAGTHKVHSVHPVSPEMVEVKEFSRSNETRLERVVQQTSPKNTGIKFADINGYVTARYDDHWWLGCVIRTIAHIQRRVRHKSAFCIHMALLELFNIRRDQIF